MRYPDFIETPFRFPPFFRVTQQYSEKQIADPVTAVAHEMTRVLPGSGIRSGHRVAVCVGSRGIDQLPMLVKGVCDCLKNMGAHPTIIPAMGSHGGATAAGQEKVLAGLGVNEANCGAPVVSTLDTVQVAHVLDGVPVYYAKDALSMDHAISINRIKPHTKFKASLESGLFKMLCVGMGKHDGALAWHKFALKYGFFELLSSMGAVLLEKTNFRFGLAVVENANHRPLIVEAVAAARLRERETALLETAKAVFPQLPLKEADVLIVDRVGKEISGGGMDPNVTGRSYDLKESDFSPIFRATRVAVLNLSEKTDGNALGIGNADFITEKVFRQLDYEKTVMNALTSNSIRKAFIPVRLPTDEKAIQACFTTLGPVDPAAIRAVVLHDTHHVSEFWASSALRKEMEALSHASVSDDVYLQFDARGNLLLPKA